jgi:hypothetical protein
MIRSKISAAFTVAVLLSLALPGGAQTSAESAAPAEAALTLVDQERFDAGWPARWVLPPGWGCAAMGDGYALRVVGAQAGLKSVARPNGVFGDVIVEGQFTFTSPDGTAQLFVRESAAGAYVAQLDAVGAVTLEKLGPGGAVVSSWRAQAEPQVVPGSARTLQLSAVAGALRVTVDGIDVLTASDPAPLPPGVNKIGAIFSTASETLTFDNYAVWIPADLNPAEASQPAMAPQAALSAPEATPPAPPTNDDFATRNTATGARYLDIGNNAGATTEASEPVPSATAATTKTVWYEFTSPASQQYLLTTFGSSFDTVLAVYTGPAVPSVATLTEVASSDNVPKSLQAQLTLSLNSGQTYYIQVGGRNSSGHFEFRIMNPADVAVPSTPTISSSAAGAPSAPVANNGSTNNLQPVLAWEPRPAVTPYAYLTELSTDPTFLSLTESAVTEHPTLFRSVGMLAVPPVPSGQKYYWHVAALNFLGQASLPSPAYSFTLDTQPLAAPALLSPAVNEVVSTLRPTLKWKPIADAVSYHAIIATNFSATTPYGSQIVDVTTPSYTPSVDIEQGEYWFAVESRDAAGNLSGAGEKRHFVINLSQVPANGSTIVAKGPAYTAPVTLTWTKIPGATYTLQIAPDSSFSVYDEHPNLTEASFTLAAHPLGSFFWRVAVNGASLPPSLARSYTVTPPLPEAPLIQTAGAISGALADQAITNDPSPAFDWTVPANWVTLAPGQSITYELQVATDSKFTQVVLFRSGLSTTNYVWDDVDLSPTPNTTYYWRVRARTNLWLPGAYSKTFTFTLDTEPLGAPVITSPALISQDFKVITGQRPVIKWQPVSGAVRYQVVIGTNFSGTTRVVDSFVNGTSFTPPSDLDLGQYWLFVESQDAAGNVRAVSSGHGLGFNVNLGQTPVDRTVLVAKAPANSMDVVFTWERVTGATTYRLEVAVDGDTSFTGDVRGFDVTGNTHTVNVPATNFATGCYWRVYKAGTTPPAGYYTSFVVLGAAPVGPSIQAGGLVQDDVITSLTPATFAWTTPSASGVYNYQLQLATDSKFSQLLITTISPASNATTYTYGASLPAGTYYWHVRALYQPSGLTTPYSQTYRFTVVEPSATMPVLTAPSANTTFSTSRPTFKWKAVAFSAGYRVRITADPNGSNPVPTAVELTKTTFTPTTDLPQGEYTFGVESKDPQGDWSGFGEIRRFVINYATAPANEAVIVAKAPAYTANVIMKWARNPGLSPANTLRVQVDNNADFSSPIATSPILPVTTSSYTFTNLPVGTYYWRILVTGHPTVPTSLAWRFTVAPPLPVAPLIENAIPALTNDATPHFDWKVPANWVTPPPGGSLSYQLQVATDKKFTQLVAGTVDVGSDTHYDWPTDLTPGTTCYWRVRAVSNLDVAGAFSKVSSFAVDLTAPTQPIPKAPADATVSTSSRPTFSWTAGTNGAVLYRLEIYDDPSFAAPPVYSASTPKLTHTPTQSLPQGIYYWKVHGLDRAGNGGDVPVLSRTVTIDCRTVPAEGDVIEAPTAAGVPVNFKWVAPTGALAGTTYTIEIDTDLDGTTDSTLPAVTTLTTTSAALPPGYYQYRLVANNGVGTTEWREFIIVPQ